MSELLHLLAGDRITDNQLRQLRDRVFGHPSTDNNWSACGPRWANADDYLWLKAHDPLRKNAEVASGPSMATHNIQSAGGRVYIDVTWEERGYLRTKFSDGAPAQRA